MSIDQSQLVVKEKQSDLTCPTVSELEVSNALKRRALAFDLVGVCTYDVMAAYHADLLDHLHTLPPPGYSAVSVQQILRADRGAFMFLSERMTSLKRNAMDQVPLDLQLPTILSRPNVAFHLLPLSGGIPKAPSAAKASNPKKRSRSPRKQQPVKGKGKGGSKGRSGKNCGQNIPAGLITTKPWRRLRSNAFVGRTTCQMVVAKPKQGEAAPRSFIYAQLDLRQSGDKWCFVTNTEERVEELVNELDEAIRTNMLPRSGGEKLRGRLQFASSQVFGRKFRRLLKVLSNHVTRGRKTLSQHTQSCLRDIRELLIRNTPRKIEASHAEVLHINVDASFDYSNYSGLGGGMIVNMSEKVISFFSVEVDTGTLDEIMAKGQKKVIQELEMMAVLAAIKVWKELIKACRVVLFTDSEAVPQELVGKRRQ